MRTIPYFYTGKAINMLQTISVIGCRDMTPPDGAWMTRDGDVIEIGCHSGSKTWSLRCESNAWVGSVGLCGKLTPYTWLCSVQHVHVVPTDRVFASGRISRLLLTTLYFVVIATDIYTCKNIFTGLDTSRKQKPSVTTSETDDAEVSLSTCTRMHQLHYCMLRTQSCPI